MKEKINTGILSFGMSGRLFHAPFVEANPGFNLYAVVERHEKKAQLKYPNILSYSSVDELLNDPLIELVIINTPNNTHFDFAKSALKAGKHVLVEKPFSATSAEAAEVFDLAQQVDRKVMVYQNRRWDSDFQSVKTTVESGVLGTLIEVHFRFDRYRNEISKKTFKETPLPASGLSYDLGPHLLDQVLSLFGKPLKWTKSLSTFRPDSLVDDYMNIHLLYPGGLNVYITASLLTAQPQPAFIINGTKGTYIKERHDVQEEQLDKDISPLDKNYGIEPDGAEGVLTRFDDNNYKIVSYITALKGNYSRLFDAAYAHVRNYETFPISSQEILWQLEILESAPDFDMRNS